MTELKMKLWIKLWFVARRNLVQELKTYIMIFALSLGEYIRLVALKFLCYVEGSSSLVYCNFMYVLIITIDESCCDSFSEVLFCPSFLSCFTTGYSEKKWIPLQTQSCGWGVEASEAIKKGEFVIEYIGEGRIQPSLFVPLLLWIAYIDKICPRFYSSMNDYS